MPGQLTLAEQLFLLGHDPDQHFEPFINVSTLAAATAGAVLADLVLTHRITVDGQGLARVGDNQRGTNAIQAEVTALVAAGPPSAAGGGRHRHQPFPLRDLITLLLPDIYDRTQAALLAAGVLTRTDHKVLGLFTRTRYTLVDERVLIRLRAEVRYAVQRGTTDAPDVGALCTLIRATRMLDTLILPLPSDELIGRLNRIVRGVAQAPPPYAAVADIGAAVEAVAGDIAVAVYR
jgi:hypothetical protein